MGHDESDAAYYERRARELGLPTDPEAYQDGGLVEACTALNLSEAEMLAALLKASGVPAWADAPLSSMYSDGYCRAYIRVLVPMGRLADAKGLVAEHRRPADGKGDPAEMAEMAAEAEASQEPPEAAEPNEEPDAAADALLRRSRTTAFLSVLGPLLAPLWLYLAVRQIITNRALARQIGRTRTLRRALMWSYVSLVALGVLVPIAIMMLFR